MRDVTHAATEIALHKAAGVPFTCDAVKCTQIVKLLDVRQTMFIVIFPCAVFEMTTRQWRYSALTERDMCAEQRMEMTIIASFTLSRNALRIIMCVTLWTKNGFEHVCAKAFIIQNQQPS